MPSTVIANPELSRGGVVLTAHSYNADDEGGVVYSASYVCLSQFDARNTALFARNTQPPTPLPESMAALRIARTPVLTNVTIDRANGLTYFNATYVAAIVGVFTETEDEVWKVFSKSVTVGAFATLNGGTNPGYVKTVTFDYISKTLSRTSKHFYPNTAFAVSLVGEPQNMVTTAVGETVNVSNPGLGTNIPGRINYKVSSVITRSRSKASSGQQSYTVNQTGIYI
jgi:hypothetical protein